MDGRRTECQSQELWYGPTGLHPGECDPLNVMAASGTLRGVPWRRRPSRSRESAATERQEPRMRSFAMCSQCPIPQPLQPEKGRTKTRPDTRTPHNLWCVHTFRSFRARSSTHFPWSTASVGDSAVWWRGQRRPHTCASQWRPKHDWRTRTPLLLTQGQGCRERTSWGSRVPSR